MNFTRKLLASSLIAAGGAVSLAVAFSATAAAEPAVPPANPGVPNLHMIEQFISLAPTNAPELIQGFASAMTGGAIPPATSASVPVAPPPTASAALTLPPAATGLPQTTLPSVTPAALAPAAAVPATTPAVAPGVMLPTAEATLPTVPGLPVPLPQSVKFPGDLATLMPANLAGLLPQPTAPAPVAVPAPVPAPGAPAAATIEKAPGTVGTPPFLPLAALP